MKEYQVVDFHTHILPGIDDGSRDVAMTEAMLIEERRQGVGLIVATPHFYADQMSIGGFLQDRRAALEEAEEVRARVRAEEGEELPEILAGAEVYYFQGMGGASEIPKLCIEGTDTLLLELPFMQWDKQVLEDVRKLIEEQGLNLVLAHLDRYPDFQRDRGVWDRILDLPLQIQLNAGSFLRSDGFLRKDRKKKFCMEYVRNDPHILLGSDCHNMSGRRPNLAKAREVIASSIGEMALRHIDAAAEAALRG